MLPLENRFFFLKSQSMMNFSRSLLLRSIEKRPIKLGLEVEIERHLTCNMGCSKSSSELSLENIYLLCLLSHTATHPATHTATHPATHTTTHPATHPAKSSSELSFDLLSLCRWESFECAHWQAILTVRSIVVLFSKSSSELSFENIWIYQTVFE